MASKTKTPARADGLTPSQVKILKVLAGSEAGLTAEEISLYGKGLPVNTITIGPAFGETGSYPQSLRAREMVYPEKYEGEEVRWFITAKGKKASSFKARKIGPENKVPPEILDPLVILFKKTRTYGLEQYTQDDIEELRSKLPEEYHEADVTDLWNQILARRKQGAFADPSEKRTKALERLIREFGPEGTVIPEFLTEDQMGQIYSALGYNEQSGEEEEDE